MALLIYLIVAMVLRKTATIEVGLCDEHRAKRRRSILIAASMDWQLEFLLFTCPTHFSLSWEGWTSWDLSWPHAG